ncbi:hypothetical protein [Gaoshiqia sp. Z1-71]|uniref:hypothetical protein n=1 Tax=Gaoshiqia hydrogeniformans TaxID=3290090 RepID=UPI003BF87A28
MKIVPIFGTQLKAIKYPEEEKDEFARLFELWQDAEYLEEFFDTHYGDLTSGYWGDINVNSAIFETYDYAEIFEERLRELSTQSRKRVKSGLDKIFRPLHNSQIQVVPLNKSKAKQDWLRIYALRIESNVYIITGGAIKLTRTMQEREHTKRELGKMEAVRKFLIENGIDDNTIELLES